MQILIVAKSNDQEIPDRVSKQESNKGLMFFATP
jgi:hypothetical protein